MMVVVYIVLGILGFFVSLQLFMVLKMKLRKGKSAPELTGKSGKAINSGKKVLFYFHSPQCRACKPMTPTVEKLSKKNKDVFVINILHDMETAKGFGVMGTPATVLVDGGKIKEFVIGVKTEEYLLNLLK